MTNKKLFEITTLFLSSIVGLMLTLYSMTAQSKTHHHGFHHNSTVTQTNIPITTATKKGLNPHVLQLALKAYQKAREKGYVKHQLLTIIDFTRASSEKRLWVLDVEKQKIIFNTLVTHGKHSGSLFAKNFSNRPGSLTSSLGLYVTENTYIGSHGYSLRLRGLEPGFNENAESRAIVMHSAWYASEDFARHHGRLGLSWGCPAVSPQILRPLVDHIKNGSLIFAYYPDQRWLSHSRFLA